jgi:hypothetical protein
VPLPYMVTKADFDRLFAVPPIRTEPGFTFSILVPPGGQLYDPFDLYEARRELAARASGSGPCMELFYRADEDARRGRRGTGDVAGGRPQTAAASCGWKGRSGKMRYRGSVPRNKRVSVIV